MTAPGAAELEALIEGVRAEDGLLGLILFGSRAWERAIDERSDHDVVVIAAEDAQRMRFEQELPFRRGEPLEVVTEKANTTSRKGSLAEAPAPPKAG